MAADTPRPCDPYANKHIGKPIFPVCLFAYGSQGLGVSAAISALIILCHFTLGVFLADRKFSLNVILKSPPFYAIIISIFLLYYDLELPGFVENTPSVKWHKIINADIAAETPRPCEP